MKLGAGLNLTGKMALTHRGHFLISTCSLAVTRGFLSFRRGSFNLKVKDVLQRKR